MPIAAIAGPLAGAAMLSELHKPFEWAWENTLGRLFGDDKGYTPEEYAYWVSSGGRAARDATAPYMAYNLNPGGVQSVLW